MDEQSDNAVQDVPESPLQVDIELDKVKHRALDALVPLMEDLKDMDAERKFDICLSAMRYTDNKNLAGAALDAALAIEENGTKAEALVELINEINYLEQNT